MNKEVNLYRLTDDVKGEVLRAVNSWRINSPFKVNALVERAIRDLEFPYSKATLEEWQSKITKVIQEPPKKPIEDIPLQNGLTAFKEHLEQLSLKSSETEKPIIMRILNTFQKTFEGM